MPAQTAILISAITGFLIGALLSMPVGPVNLTIQSACKSYTHS